MAFAQLTYRESLRDIESCLSVQTSKLYSMGFRDPVRRSTLADANEARDWRIYAELAQRVIGQARRLYVNEDLGFDLANTVYALDSTTIDLCLAVFPWAHFRTTKAAVKMHTLKAAQIASHLLVEPDVLEARAVVDAVDHLGHPLHPWLVADRRAGGRGPAGRRPRSVSFRSPIPTAAASPGRSLSINLTTPSPRSAPFVSATMRGFL
jgi:hypothetical protein